MSQTPLREFCTYFDSHYVTRGLALYESLRRHCPRFRLWVLCLDDVALSTLQTLGLPGVRPIALEEFEDPLLRRARAQRPTIEYYFTCTPSLPAFVFAQAPTVDLVTYLDADLFFYADPEPVFSEIDGASIAVVEHRFPEHTAARFADAGRFNVGWVSFRRDAEGLACLEAWRSQCLEWCGDASDGARYADQKYLDAWPGQFAGFHSISHAGANVAPWNLATGDVERKHGRIYVQGVPLLFFHFHGLSELRPCIYETKLSAYGARSSMVIAREIYAPYIRSLRDVTTRFVLPDSSRRPLPPGLPRGEQARTIASDGPGRRSLRGRLGLWRRVLAGRYLVMFGGIVISAGA